MQGITTTVRGLVGETVGEVVPASKVTTALVDEMWAVWRQEFEPLRGEAVSRRRLLDLCEDVTTVGLARKAQGDLGGFWSARAEYRTWGGRSFSQVYVPHYVIRRDFRGSVAPYLTAVRSFLRTAAPHPRSRMYVVANALPGSYIAIRSGPTSVTTLEDGDPWERRLLRDVIASRATSDWDPGSGLVHGHAVPRDALRPMHPRGGHAAAYEDYLRLNPTWREGTVLPILVRVRLDPVAWARQIAGRRRRVTPSSSS